MKIYTGIGSRECPIGVMANITRIARDLNTTGWTLRSGGADGADSAFEAGSTNKEIFLPWENFNKNSSSLVITDKHMEYANQHNIHPTWDRLSVGAKRLHARNCCQVLGFNLDTPTKFVLCWTKDGIEQNPTKDTGGTGTAIRLANKLNIPVINMNSPMWEERLFFIVEKA